MSTGTTGVKISELNSGTTIFGDELFVMVQGGVTKNVSADDFLSGITTDIADLSAKTEQIEQNLSGLTFSGTTYTGDSTVSIGGINSGDVFIESSMQDMWYALLHPYQAPSVNLNSNLPNTVEVGTTLNADYTFTWNTSNDSNVNGTLTLSGPSLNLTGLVTDGSTGITVNLQQTTATSSSWTIQGTNTEAGSFSSSESVIWRYKRFYGTYSGTSISDSQIINQLTGEFSTNRTKSWSQDGNGEYIYYVYPSSFGDASGAPFNVNGLPNTAWTKEIRNIILSTGLSVEYIIYRTNTIQNGTGINIEKL